MLTACQVPGDIFSVEFSLYAYSVEFSLFSLFIHPRRASHLALAACWLCQPFPPHRGLDRLTDCIQQRAARRHSVSAWLLVLACWFVWSYCSCRRWYCYITYVGLSRRRMDGWRRMDTTIWRLDWRRRRRMFFLFPRTRTLSLSFPPLSTIVFGVESRHVVVLGNPGHAFGQEGRHGRAVAGEVFIPILIITNAVLPFCKLIPAWPRPHINTKSTVLVITQQRRRRWLSLG